MARATSPILEVDYTAPKPTVQAFSAEVAADTLDAMQAVTEPGGTGERASSLGRPVAGKTGTTDSRKSAWWTGVVPQLSVSVGMYRDVGGKQDSLSGIPGLNSGLALNGNSVPLSIWLDFMRVATQNLPVQGFPARAGIGDDKIAVAPTQTFTPPPVTSSTPPPTTSTPPPTTTTSSPPPAPPSSTTTTQTRTRTSPPTPKPTPKPTPSTATTSTGPGAADLPAAPGG